MESAESEAHREIRNLVAAYNAFGDRGRFDELMGLFEPDAVMEIGDGHTYEGVDRIREGGPQGDSPIPPTRCPLTSRGGRSFPSSDAR